MITDRKEHPQYEPVTYLCLYLRERVFQKSISSSFEENFGIISVSIANKSGDEGNKNHYNEIKGQV